jgi:hypothetical protein
MDVPPACHAIVPCSERASMAKCCTPLKAVILFDIKRNNNCSFSHPPRAFTLKFVPTALAINQARGTRTFFFVLYVHFIYCAAPALFSSPMQCNSFFLQQRM